MTTPSDRPTPAAPGSASTAPRTDDAPASPATPAAVLDGDRAAGGASGTIRRAEDDLRLPAIARLVGSPGSGARAHAERFLAHAADHGIDLSQLWTEVDRRGHPVRTVLAVPNPGRTSVFFAGPVAVPSTVPRMAALIQHVARSLDPEAVHLAQGLLEPAERSQAAAFVAGGFTRLADLAYLERPMPIRRIGPASLPADVRIVPWSADRRADVLQILESSYEDTLDCPGLRGLRHVSDILDGHMGAGVFVPELWRLLMVDDEPAGVAMLNVAPSSDAVELVYLGLGRRARGRGLGRILLQDALNGLVGRPEQSVTLAVDLRNAPALGLYRSMDFRRTLRRVAFVRSLRPDRIPIDAPPSTS